MEDRRWQPAEQELRELLRTSSRNADVHALLALCLVECSIFENAREEAALAIRLDKYNSLSHYARSVVALAADEIDVARVAAMEAVRLEPTRGNYFAQLAKVEFELGNWSACRRAAEQGIALAPQHAECLGLLKLSHAKLNGGGEFDGAGESDAGESKAARELVKQGDELLTQGQPQQALEQFREATELSGDPSIAKHGIVRALKARSVFYRVLLGLTSHLKYAGMGLRLTHIIMVFVLHAYFAGQFGPPPFLRDHGEVTLYAFSFYTAFLVCGAQVFNLVLLTSRYGRLIVTRVETMAAICVVLCIIASWCMVAIGYFTFPGNEQSWRMGYPPLLVTYSIAFVFAGYGGERTVLGFYAAAHGAVVLITCIKWASHSIDAQALQAAMLNNRFINPIALAELNNRVAEVDQWIAYSTYGVFGAIVILRLARMR